VEQLLLHAPERTDSFLCPGHSWKIRMHAVHNYILIVCLFCSRESAEGQRTE